MNKDIMICGVGGQGTVLSSRIIAAAAMDEGSPVHSAETIGMAQRGGSVTSHVRIGETAYSPLIPSGSAELLLAFEPAEAVRNLRYLNKNGTVIANTVPVQPVSGALSGKGYDVSVMTEYLKGKCDCVFVDSDELCRPYGSSRYFNIIILGIASGLDRLGIKKDTLLEEIEKKVPAKHIRTNIEAFLAGYERGREQGERGL
ncbi:MAG TPA: pyruvate ferredoxin oxidoreductase [Lachnospiraceae bacterium]|nr:pyruvate ferredoxin oxidoreductase [Lachnospiraceae bacterium]